MAHAIRQPNPPQYRRIPAFRSRPMSGWDGVAAGLLAASTNVGSGGGTISGSGTTLMSITGTLAQVNADLTTLTYTNSTPGPDSTAQG